MYQGAQVKVFFEREGASTEAGLLSGMKGVEVVSTDLKAISKEDLASATVSSTNLSNFPGYQTRMSPRKDARFQAAVAHVGHVLVLRVSLAVRVCEPGRWS